MLEYTLNMVSFFITSLKHGKKLCLDLVSFSHRLETWEKTMLEISMHAPNIMTQLEVHSPQDSFHLPK